jgi:hypothetical protein
MRYQAPLVEWISFALNRSCLDQTLESIRKGKKIQHLPAVSDTNRRYLEKILREEVVKQFNDFERPMLELVLNSIDAKIRGVTDYNVKMLVKRRSFTVIDDGNSMTLEQILRFLIIPFNTEKDGIEQIGKFGVGFLSNFYYCINDRRTSITVYTITKDESYSLKFFCPSTSVSDIVLELKHIRRSKKPRTIVKIDNLTYRRSKLITYLTQHLVNIPSYMAKLTIDGVWINEGYRTPWISVPVTLQVKDKEIVQEVGFCRASPASSSFIVLTSQGVKVKVFSCNVNGAIISFPSAVRVVEGRDEFKIDDNYKKCVYAAFEAFEQHAQIQNVKDICFTIELFSELVSAFQVEYIKNIPNIDRIEKILFGDKKYMLLTTQYDELAEFLGKACLDKIIRVYPASFQLWSNGFNVMSDFFNHHMKPVLVLDMEKEKTNYHRLSLLGILLRLLNFGQERVRKVIFVRVDPGTSPFYFEGIGSGILYINIRHFLCRGSLTAMKLFGMCSELYRSEACLSTLHGRVDSNKEIAPRILFRTVASFYDRAISTRT